MKYLIIFILIIISNSAFSQELKVEDVKVRDLKDLLVQNNSGWKTVKEWIKNASNKVEILKFDSISAKKCLKNIQVTNNSPMGGIIYNSGGLLIDNGWIRILGSGNNDKLNRSMDDWNINKSVIEYGYGMPFVLIADDVIGGFFALNGGYFGNDWGKIYYFSPDTLIWEPLGISYSGFINWCFNGDLKLFYKDKRWRKWKEEINELNGNEVINFYPYLWSEEFNGINKVSRQKIPIEEIWTIQIQLSSKLSK